jgi:hypothetical protein
MIECVLCTIASKNGTVASEKAMVASEKGEDWC